MDLQLHKAPDLFLRVLCCRKMDTRNMQADDKADTKAIPTPIRGREGSLLLRWQRRLHLCFAPVYPQGETRIQAAHQDQRRRTSGQKNKKNSLRNTSRGRHRDHGHRKLWRDTTRTNRPTRKKNKMLHKTKDQA